VDVAGTNRAGPSCREVPRVGEEAVQNKEHLERQAATFLDLARSTKNPKLAAALEESAAYYTSQADSLRSRGNSSRPPDVES
jgi:hypothetical protein